MLEVLKASLKSAGDRELWKAEPAVLNVLPEDIKTAFTSFKS